MATDLPFIDEYDRVIEAPSASVFMALSRRVGRSFEGPGGRAFTALLACRHQGASFTIPPSVGQEVNGFRVAEVIEPGTSFWKGSIVLPVTGSRSSSSPWTKRGRGCGPEPRPPFQASKEPSIVDWS